MRSALLIIVALGSISAFADSTNAPLSTTTNLLTFTSAPAITNAPVSTNAPGGTMAESLVADGWVAKSKEDALSFELRPNEIKVGRLTLDGVGVQLAKADNPLQLLNPFAPAKYGSPEDNVFRSPVDGKISGLKVFEVKF